MSAALALVVPEDVPRGAKDAAPAPIGQRRCRCCTEDLMRNPHAPWCPERPVIWRGLPWAPETVRLDDLLEEATRRAMRAWLASGRTL